MHTHGVNCTCFLIISELLSHIPLYTCIGYWWNVNTRAGGNRRKTATCKTLYQLLRTRQWLQAPRYCVLPMPCHCQRMHLALTGEIYPSRFSQRVSYDSKLGPTFVYFHGILGCFQVHMDRILSDLNHWQQWWNVPRYNRICRNKYTTTTTTTTIKHQNIKTSNTKRVSSETTTRQPHRNRSKIQNLFCPKQQSFPGFTKTHHPKEHLLFAQVVHQCLCQLRDVFPQHFFTFSGRFHCSLQTVFHHRLGGPRQFLRVIPVALA